MTYVSIAGSRFGLDPNGPLFERRPLVVDLTPASDINKAIQALPSGGGHIRIGRGTHTLTAQISIDRPVHFSFDPAAVIESNGFNFMIRSPRVTMDWNGAKFTFTPGAAASALNRAVRVPANVSAAMSLGAAVSAGATSFTASSVADAATLATGNWLVLGEWDFNDWQACEWKQVLSVAGTTVNVTSPFRRGYGTTYTGRWYKITALREDITIRGMHLTTVATGEDAMGIDAQYCRGLTIEGCVFDIAEGMAFQTYSQDAPRIIGNRIRRQVGARSSFSACVDGVLDGNVFDSQGAAPSDGALSIETGTSYCTIANNRVRGGAGSSAIFFNQWGDYNRYIANDIVGDGSTTGIYIFGGVGNVLMGNVISNVGTAIRFGPDADNPSPSRTSDSNKAIGNIIRNAATGVRVAGTANEVRSSGTDSSVTSALTDEGTNTVTD